MALYVSAFDDARVVEIERFGADEEESGLKRARFTLAGRDFIAMDSGRAHAFTFTPSMSLFVDFDSEQQLDQAFEKLSDGGPSSCRCRPMTSARNSRGSTIAMASPGS